MGLRLRQGPLRPRGSEHCLGSPLVAQSPTVGAGLRPRGQESRKPRGTGPGRSEAS
jgi:hypothetical protein